MSAHGEVRSCPPTLCRWFLACDKTATHTVHHPVLGDVPVCGRCADRVGISLATTITVAAPTHHLAFRLSEAVPICGSEDGGGLSLQADRVTCEQCRRICELGPREAES